MRYSPRTICLSEKFTSSNIFSIIFSLIFKQIKDDLKDDDVKPEPPFLNGFLDHYSFRFLFIPTRFHHGSYVQFWVSFILVLSIFLFNYIEYALLFTFHTFEPIIFFLLISVVVFHRVHSHTDVQSQL